MRRATDPRRRTAWSAMAGALALVFATGCVSVAEHRKLERDVRKLKQGQGDRSARSDIADLSSQIDALREDLKRLEGRLDEVSHESKRALSESQRARKEAASVVAASIPAVEGEPPPGGELAPGDEPAAGEPLPLGAHEPATMQPEAGASRAEAQDDERVEAEAEAEGAPPAGKSAEVSAYREAYAAWRSEDDATCIDRFRQFLQTYPSSGYADDAAYWMADCYFRQGDYRTAVVRFDDVVTRYPQGNKAADALYREGEALVRLGPSYTKAARKAFERVVREYPESGRAKEAQNQLKLLGTG